MVENDKTLHTEHAVKIVGAIKSNKLFPFDTGNLKNKATSWHLTSDGFVIQINGTIAPYAQYLQEGTRPHNIPRAFGRPLPFGTSGNFGSNGERLGLVSTWQGNKAVRVKDMSGYFHPGSTKHQGWIDFAIVGEIFDFYKKLEKESKIKND